MKVSLKKQILIGIASTAGVVLVIALGWLLYFKLQFSIFQDMTNKFTINYPKTWQLYIRPRAHVAVAFVRPKDTALDTFKENFTVTVQQVPDDIFTLEAYSASIKRQMTGVFGKHINIVEDKPVQWGWREGHRFTIEAPAPDHLKMVNVWLIDHNQAYILTFLGDIRKYNQDGILIDEMIRSFKLQ